MMRTEPYEGLIEEADRFTCTQCRHTELVLHITLPKSWWYMKVLNPYTNEWGDYYFCRRECMQIGLKKMARTMERIWANDE